MSLLSRGAVVRQNFSPAEPPFFNSDVAEALVAGSPSISVTLGCLIERQKIVFACTSSLRPEDSESPSSKTTPMSSQQSRRRAAYKRNARDLWNSYKGTVRELFLEQKKTHEEVTRILQEEHGIEIG